MRLGVCSYATRSIDGVLRRSHVVVERHREKRVHGKPGRHGACSRQMLSGWIVARNAKGSKVASAGCNGPLRTDLGIPRGNVGSVDSVRSGPIVSANA